MLADLLRQAADPYEECVVAHFMAHAQEDVESQLTWHRRALEAAGSAERERVTAFLPSLHANLAEAHLRRGEVELARAQLEEARRSAHRLGSDAYGETVRALLERLGHQIETVAPTTTR